MDIGTLASLIGITTWIQEMFQSNPPEVCHFEKMDDAEDAGIYNSLKNSGFNISWSTTANVNKMIKYDGYTCVFDDPVSGNPTIYTVGRDIQKPELILIGKRA